MRRAPQPPPPEPERLKRLAILVSRGSANNLFQVATLIRAATALDAEVGVLFREEALLKLAPDRINDLDWSPAYAIVRDSLVERLRSADFTDMATFLRDAKEHGDAVHYWASSETLEARGTPLSQLTSLLDGERAETRFIEDARNADALLSF